MFAFVIHAIGTPDARSKIMVFLVIGFIFRIKRNGLIRSLEQTYLIQMACQDAWTDILTRILLKSYHGHHDQARSCHKYKVFLQPSKDISKLQAEYSKVFQCALSNHSNFFMCVAKFSIIF